MTMPVLPISEAMQLRLRFFGHPRARRYIDRHPTLGEDVPLMHVVCDGDLQTATGLVVSGQGGDADGFDLDGSFTLFSCDYEARGEFITVNGWVGAVTCLENLAKETPHDCAF